MLGNSSIADEVFNATMYRVYSRLPRDLKPGHFKPYVFRAAFNGAVNASKRELNLNRHSSQDSRAKSSQQTVDPMPDPEASFPDRELLRLTHKLLLKSGVYTHYLVEALASEGLADANGDGAVSVSEAHTYSRDKTMAHTGMNQVPWANYLLIGSGLNARVGWPE